MEPVISNFVSFLVNSIALLRVDLLIKSWWYYYYTNIIYISITWDVITYLIGECIDTRWETPVPRRLFLVNYTIQQCRVQNTIFYWTDSSE